MQGIENLSEEAVAENFPKLVREMDTQAQEAQSPRRDEPKQAHTRTRHNENTKG